MSCLFTSFELKDLNSISCIEKIKPSIDVRVLKIYATSSTVSMRM